MWYEGEIGAYASFYGTEPSSSTFEDYGHFTQVVWKATTHVGCGTVHCGDSWMTACNYKVAGKIYRRSVVLSGVYNTDNDYRQYGGLLCPECLAPDFLN